MKTKNTPALTSITCHWFKFYHSSVNVVRDLPPSLQAPPSLANWCAITAQLVLAGMGLALFQVSKCSVLKLIGLLLGAPGRQGLHAWPCSLRLPPAFSPPR